MSDPIHLRDICQSTLVYFKFILYFNPHFYTSIVIVTHEPFAFSPSEQGKYSQHVDAAAGIIDKAHHVNLGVKKFGWVVEVSSVRMG